MFGQKIKKHAIEQARGGTIWYFMTVGISLGRFKITEQLPACDYIFNYFGYLKTKGIWSAP